MIFPVIVITDVEHAVLNRAVVYAILDLKRTLPATVDGDVAWHAAKAMLEDASLWVQRIPVNGQIEIPRTIRHMACMAPEDCLSDWDRQNVLKPLLRKVGDAMARGNCSSVVANIRKTMEDTNS